MLLLIFQKVNFFLSLFECFFSSCSVLGVERFNFSFLFTNSILKLFFLMVQILNSTLKISLSMFSLQLFSHSKGNWALIKCLICLYGHSDFVSYSQQKKTSFWFSKSNLSDDFIETLGEKFFSYWTDSTFSGLSLHKFLIEHFSKSGDIDSGCWLMADVLNVMFAGFGPFSWWKDCV